MYDIVLYLSILFCEILFFSILMMRAKTDLISLGIAFNGYALLYFFVGLIFYETLINGWYNDINLLLISKLCCVAIISFNIFYFLAPKVKSDNDYIPSRQITVFACLFGVASQLLLIIVVGPINFFTMDRVSRFVFFDKYKILLLLSGFMYIGLVMSGVRYYFTGFDSDKKILKKMAVFILIYAIATVSRTHITILAITIGYLLEQKNIVTKRKMLILFASLAIIMLFFKGFLYNIFFSEMGYESFNPGEFINWIRNTINVFDSGFAFSNGSGNFSSYLLTLESLFMISPNGEPLSIQYINEFYPDDASAGLTYGFSGIAEGYLSAGYYGVIFHFGVLGFFLGFIEKRKTFVSMVLSVFLIFLLFRVFRSESYNIVRTFSWYYLYPFFILVLSDKVLRRL